MLQQETTSEVLHQECAGEVLCTVAGATVHVQQQGSVIDRQGYSKKSPLLFVTHGHYRHVITNAGKRSFQHGLHAHRITIVKWSMESLVIHDNMMITFRLLNI